MEWTEAQQQELHRFLANFTNPDPHVQASNLQQLDALAQYPYALFAVCGVVCDSTSSSTVRLSATTVARQLLWRQTHVSYYLGSTSDAAALQSSLQQLMSALLKTTFSPGSATFPPSLRRATTSLIAALLKALTLDEVCFLPATVLWTHLMSYLLHQTAQTTASSTSLANCQTASLEPCAQSAALLRELCDAALTTSRPLREWVGGQVEHTTAFCSLLSQQLQSLQLALASHLSSPSSKRSTARAQVLATWMENLLAAFSSCLDSGVLPSTTADSLADISTEAGDGPAMQALRAVSNSVVHLHTSIQAITLNVVLHPVASWGEQSEAASVDLHSSLQSTAPFVAVSMRYLADAVLVESFDALNGYFQREAMPHLAQFCHAAARAQLTYDGAGEPDSVHAAVVACVTYTAQLVHVEHFLGFAPSCSTHNPEDWQLQQHRQRMTAPYVACVHQLLLSAATLPTSLAEHLEEHTAQQPDSAAEMLVKSAAGRRRGQRNSAKATCAHNNDLENACGALEDGSVGAADAADDKEEGESDGFAMADALEAQLPDNGTLRQAVAWCANSLTCNTEWLAALLPIVTSVSLSTPPTQLPDVCAMEAALFVCNEILDAALTDQSVWAAAGINGSGSDALGGQLSSQLSSVLQLLPAPSNSSSVGVHCVVPFYLRLQAVRYLGRLGGGLLEAWKGLGREGEKEVEAPVSAGPQAQQMAHHTYRTLSPAGGLEGLLWTLTHVLTTDVNKGVQVECVRVLTSLVTGCLHAVETVLKSSVGKRRAAADASDLEEESLDDESSSNSGSESRTGSLDTDQQLRNNAGGPLSTPAMQAMHLLCQSLSLTPGLDVFPRTLQLVCQHFAHFQWSVRQSIYHLYSETIPLLWTLTEKPLQQQQHTQQDQLSSVLWACGDGAAVAASQALVRTVTSQVLEVLAGHYMALLSSVRDSLFEMASLLSCMADVATAMDAAALETVLPWILQVAHHVLNLYADYLAHTHSHNSNRGLSTSSTSFEAAVDMTDMCMVSLDLISCVCDGLIDRDALLVCQMTSTRQTEVVAAMDQRIMALAAALLNTTAVGTSDAAAGSSSATEDALPNRCVALLSLCQARADHPSHARAAVDCTRTSVKGQGDLPRTSDEFGEVRRACFAVLYDCVLLLAYAESLLRPSLPRATATLGAGQGISGSLGKDLFALCLREVMPGGAASLDLSLLKPPTSLQLRVVSMQNAAASDAWLCLGALLTLWDQQSWWAQKRGPHQSSGGHGGEGVSLAALNGNGPIAVFTTNANLHVSQQKQYYYQFFENLLALLGDKKFVVESYLKLNMTSAACAFAVLLATPLPVSVSPANPPGQSSVSCATLTCLLSVASSTRVRDYAPDAASGDPSGLSEAMQILWCLGRVWQDAVQMLPHDALCALLQRQGKEMAKTAAWLLRCVTVQGTARALSSSPFWSSLLGLWHPVAQTLTDASQAGVFPLTLSQKAALKQLIQL